MSIAIEPQIDYFYDTHPVEDEEMSESEPHDAVLYNLTLVLRWLFYVEKWYIARNLRLYVTADRLEKPLAPDAAVFIGVPYSRVRGRNIKSWTIRPPEQPAPRVVFEIISDDSWDRDINEKPARYASMGIQECFVYDPRPYPAEDERLRGWRNDGGVAVALIPDKDGRIWSVELESWLVSDGLDLRLYDRDGRMRLTGEKAHRQAIEAERQAKERAWAVLRKLGYDPEELA
jgi:Uma2 family endonuclease